jgi:hypothetical protein
VQDDQQIQIKLIFGARMNILSEDSCAHLEVI